MAWRELIDTFDQITLERADRVATITLNRPELLNAIGPQMIGELFSAFEVVESDPGVWIAIITGAGRAFSSGFDMKAIARHPEDARQSDPLSGSLDDLYEYVGSLKKPVVAAVNGHCLGPGAGLALLADIRVAAESATFGWPQVRRGMVTTSGPAILAHRVPLGFAFKLLLSGQRCTAAEALSMGLVQDVIPDADLMVRVTDFVQDIADNCAPIALRTIKEATLANLYVSDLRTRIRRTAEINARVRGNLDSVEGLRAYDEGRDPKYAGV